MPRDTGYKQPWSCALQFLYFQQLHKKKEKEGKKERNIPSFAFGTDVWGIFKTQCSRNALDAQIVLKKNSDKLSTAVLTLLSWKITSANSFSKSNYKDLGNRTKNFKIRDKLRDWNLRTREGGEGPKAAVPITAE